MTIAFICTLKTEHKTSYVHGFINKNNIKEWLKYLVQTPFYIHYKIEIDDAFLNRDQVAPQLVIDDVSEHVPIEDNLTAQQQTLLWNEDKVLHIAPGEQSSPLSILFDEYAEVLSFPTIYYGQFRNYREESIVSPFMQATSELRRTNRRCADPHLLYLAAKIMRVRVSQSFTIAFKHFGNNTTITKEQIHIIDENPEFDIVDITKKVSIDVLHSIGMSTQEARSIATVYIPTIYPSERQRIMKWMMIVQTYGKKIGLISIKKRPEKLNNVTLAQFVAKYYINIKVVYTERYTLKIIRYRFYDMADNFNDYR
ncbi:hypothetical protein JTB14_014121 [Gonioctena quinquepunctata]|nr:hypothetical protein JTB14_014121 [Gonioctena quinquepunctata]